MPYIIRTVDGKRFDLTQAVFTADEIDRLRGDGHTYTVQNTTTREIERINPKRKQRAKRGR